MSTHLLKQFHTPANCYAVELACGETDTLGILCLHYLEDAPEQGASLLSLILFNLQTQATEAVITYNGMGPDRLSSLASDALVTYDAHAHRWVIAQLQREWYLGVRTVTKQPEGTYTLSPLCLLESGQGERGMNPLLTLECQEDVYRVVYHRDVFEHLHAGEVRAMALSLHSPDWEKLQEQARVISLGSNGVPRRYTWQEWLRATSVQPLAIDYLQPEGAMFDPGTASAHQTDAVSIKVQQVVAESENAMVYRDAHFQVLALACPEGWVKPKPSASQARPSEHGAWRIWLTGWDTTWTEHQWTYASTISVPADASLPAWEYPPWPEAEAALTAGPPVHQEATLIAALTLQAFDGETLHSQMVCLDTTGKLIQRCQERVGRYPHLACCGNMVVGVDRQESGWQLWNWAVHQSTHFQKTIMLDALCQRSYVHADEATSWFWLVEELPSGVQVSRRDATSLAELGEAVWLPETKLLTTQTELRPLNGYHDRGIIPLKSELVLCVEDQQGELALYKI